MSLELYFRIEILRMTTGYTGTDHSYESITVIHVAYVLTFCGRAFLELPEILFIRRLKIHRAPKY